MSKFTAIFSLRPTDGPAKRARATHEAEQRRIGTAGIILRARQVQAAEAKRKGPQFGSKNP